MQMFIIPCSISQLIECWNAVFVNVCCISFLFLVLFFFHFAKQYHCISFLPWWCVFILLKASFFIVGSEKPVMIHRETSV